MVLGGAALLAAVAAIAWTRRIPAVHHSAPPVIVAPSEANFTASVQPRNTIAVQPPAEGILDAWFVDVGQSVYKDQLLGRVRVPKLEDAARQAQTDLDQMQSRAGGLDSAQMAAKLEISRAEAEQARAATEIDRLKKIYDRYKSLWDLGAIARLPYEKSEKDYNDAKAAAENADKAAKAAKDRVDAIAAEIGTMQNAIAEKTHAVEQAKADLAGGDLHSPADGIVFVRQGDPGQTVDPSLKNLIEIATDLTQLQVTLTPSAEDLPRLHAGQTAEVHFGDAEFPGTVREIRGPQVIVDFTTSAPIAKLGESAQVRIKF
jgi:multidrug resistance efflux pump